MGEAEKRQHEVNEMEQKVSESNFSAPPSQANILLMLQNSISSLNQKFESFQSGFEGKINSIEQNYNTLSHKID